MGKIKGYILVIIATSLWGVSGAVAQKIFIADVITVEWLVTVRLLISGLLFLVYAYFGKDKKLLASVFKHKPYILQFIIFAILGMAAVQYTFFAAISEGNAAVATLLQYIAPIFIMFYFLFILKQKPSFLELIAVALALLGTFLILTNGSLQSISITKLAIFWGISSAVALAFYTIYSDYLVRHFPSVIVMGYGMFGGGIFMSFIESPFAVDLSNLNSNIIGSIIFVIIFGTLIPFLLFSESLRYITAKETSLLACSEPLAAIIVSVVWLNTSFGLFQALGSFFIILMVYLIAINPAKKQIKKDEFTIKNNI